MDNMKVYNAVREVPDTAKKQILGGRLKGMTDINPMWRIKALTEQFGICGFGWKYDIVKQWTEQTNPETIVAFVNINLYIKQDGEWSEAIPGTGGSSLYALEKNGPYTNDECYKMALTDALSVACKALGFGADIYWTKDNTKYSDGDKERVTTKIDKPDFGDASAEYKCVQCGREFSDWTTPEGKRYTAKELHDKAIEKHGSALCSKACVDAAKQAGA